MADTNTRRRVKLYMLNESRVWDDQGTGHVTSNYLDKCKGTALIVRSEVDGNVLLESKVHLNTAYQKQQETLIVWSEADNFDYALSFQDKAGCDEIWEKICQVQGKDPSVEITQDVAEVDAEDMDDDHFDDVHDPAVTSTTASATLDLPACELGRLEEIAELFTGTLPTTPIRRERLALAVENDSYIKKLLDVYHQCEDLEDINGLHQLYAIFKTLFMLNKTALLETMFADDVIMDIIGVLENDPALTQPASHREYLRSQAQLREVIPLTNSELVQKIHQTYRVQYIQDVILPTPSVFEENLLSTLSSFIYFNKMEIVTLVQEDDKFLQSLFRQLKDEETDNAKRRDLILFLKEFCTFSQTLAQQNREGFFKTLSNFGILNTVKVILGYDDAVMRSAAVDIFSFIVEFNPSMVREFILHEVPKQNYDDILINIFIDLMTSDSDPELGGAMQAMAIVRLLIDPENMVTTTVKKVISEKTEKSEFLSFFYTHCMHVLMAPLYSNTTGDSPVRDDYHTAQLLSLILDLLTFCVEHHTYHSKNYIINKNVLRRVLVLLKSRHAFLCLAALRLLRRMIGLKDEFYNRYIVKFDLLKPVSEAFVANGHRYNLFNSAVIELFEFIRTEDLKTLIMYFVERHYKLFENILYVQTFRILKQRHEQYLDRLTDKSSSFDTVESLTSVSRSAANRFKRDSRTLDEDEEMWFDQDDDDDTDLDLVKSRLDLDYVPLDKLLTGNNKLSVSCHKTMPRIVNKSMISINIQRTSAVSSTTVSTTSTVSSSEDQDNVNTSAKASSIGLVDYPDEDAEDETASNDDLSMPSAKRTRLGT